MVFETRGDTGKTGRRFAREDAFRRDARPVHPIGSANRFLKSPVRHFRFPGPFLINFFSPPPALISRFPPIFPIAKNYRRGDIGAIVESTKPPCYLGSAPPCRRRPRGGGKYFCASKSFCDAASPSLRCTKSFCVAASFVDAGLSCGKCSSASAVPRSINAATFCTAAGSGGAPITCV